MSAMKPAIQQTLDTLPTKPGVYLMQNDDGTILYVGKAVNLRNRVRSYFHGNAFDAKVISLTAHVEKIEFIVTDTELEALVLENNLIKKHRPKYNIRLKDAKTYPYIKITWQDNFPKVFMTRRMDDDGARYFGPFTAVWAVHETLDTLRKIFPYLTCDREITGKDKRACLYYDIGLCLAPCIGAASRDEYRGMIDRLSQFLQGHSDEVTQNIHDKLHSAAENLEFERAAVYRDQLQAIARITEHQKVVSPQMVDQDVIAFAKDDGNACVQIFFIRAGKLLGREYFVLEGTTHANTDDVLSSFVQQFYDQAAFIPPEILLPEMIDEAKIIESWLKQNKGATTTIRVPYNGDASSRTPGDPSNMRDDASGHELMQMAQENARITLDTIKQQWLADKTKHLQAVEELQQALEMENPPLRMECYDISNIQGTNSVGAMVVFENGAAKKSDYRKFKIKTVDGPNDFASLQEMLRRRFKRYQEAKKAEQASGEWSGESRARSEEQGATNAESPTPVPQPQPKKSKIPLSKGIRTAERKNDESWARMPDLVIIDGGKGQLSAAEEVFKEKGIEGVKLISLAKRQEEVFTPNRVESLRLPKNSAALHLLQRIRDEAHRFGITYHRSVRAKKGLHSQLDAIPGIGPRRRRALLQTFGSLEAIRDASVQDLMQVEGMSKSAAQKLKESL